MAPSVLSLAVCLYDGVAATDFQGSLELFGFISPKSLENKSWSTDPAYVIEPSYLAVTLDPVTSMSGPALLPTRTYDSVKPSEQFDIVFVPGGKLTRADVHRELQQRGLSCAQVTEVARESHRMPSFSSLRPRLQAQNTCFRCAQEQRSQLALVYWTAVRRRRTNLFSIVLR